MQLTVADLAENGQEDIHPCSTSRVQGLTNRILRRGWGGAGLSPVDRVNPVTPGSWPWVLSSLRCFLKSVSNVHRLVVGSAIGGRGVVGVLGIIRASVGVVPITC